MLSCRIKNKAFSFLELVVCVAVLSIGIVAVIQAFSFSARMTKLSCDVSKAVLLAQDKMQELEMKERMSLLGKEATQETGEAGAFEWNRQLALGSATNLYSAQIQVNWQERDRQDDIKVRTLLRP